MPRARAARRRQFLRLVASFSFRDEESSDHPNGGRNDRRRHTETESDPPLFLDCSFIALLLRREKGIYNFLLGFHKWRQRIALRFQSGDCVFSLLQRIFLVAYKR